MLCEFDLGLFLDSPGVCRAITHYAHAAVIFRQGAPADAVMYVQQGGVRLSVSSAIGKQAVIGLLGIGDFFGEGCLAGQSQRTSSATAMNATTLLVVEKAQMAQMLHDEPLLADRFLVHMLARSIRSDEDLVDRLLNPCEKRLARILVQMARYGDDDVPLQVIHNLSQETLSEMVGATRSRINFFMNKFRDLGFVEYDLGWLKVNRSLLTVVDSSPKGELL